MDPATLYMLVICTKAGLCYPVDPPTPCADKGFCYRNETAYFTRTKAECEAIIANRARKDGSRARLLSCFTEDEWTRRFPERPERIPGPIAR
jgi:hypothetical protein